MCREVRIKIVIIIILQNALYIYNIERSDKIPEFNAGEVAMADGAF